MKLYDEVLDEEVDPATVDWSQVGKSNFAYKIVQGSGSDNALGLVKFPLTNPWSIYMHDTNERHLFSKEQRLLSSGCIRLEKPFAFAEYLLRDQPAYSGEKINDIVEAGLNPDNNPLPTRIKVKKSLPVYTSFITTDISAEGILRFSDDIYGSDARLAGILSSKDSALTANVEDMKGSEWTDLQAEVPDKKAVLGFVGNPSESQISKIVKLYKCIKNKRNSCELVHALDFNKNYLVDAGDYIAIYENQIFHEVITLASKATRTVKMVDIEVINVFAAEPRVKIFHDLNASIEQKRILMENFYFAQSPLKFSQYDFGDFYLSSLGMKVMNERIEYSLCLNSKGVTFTEEGADVCRIYRGAKSPEGLNRLFTFGAASFADKYSDGEFTQSWVSKPGDRTKISHKRRLLAAPLASTDRILVFQGAYKARGEQSGKTMLVKANAAN
jgi:hypothetical protein